MWYYFWDGKNIKNILFSQKYVKYIYMSNVLIHLDIIVKHIDI